MMSDPPRPPAFQRAVQPSGPALLPAAVAGLLRRGRRGREADVCFVKKFFLGDNCAQLRPFAVRRTVNSVPAWCTRQRHKIPAGLRESSGSPRPGIIAHRPMERCELYLHYTRFCIRTRRDFPLACAPVRARAFAGSPPTGIPQSWAMPEAPPHQQKSMVRLSPPTRIRTVCPSRANVASGASVPR